MTKPRDTFAKQLAKPVRWLMLLTMLANCALLVLELSSWISAIIGLLLIYQALVICEKIRSPNKPMIWLIAITGTILLAWQSKQNGVLISMLNLLCFSYALKQFELNRRQDFYLQTVLGIFVLAAAMIFQQSLEISVLFIAVLILNLLPLLSYFSSDNFSISATNNQIESNRQLKPAQQLSVNQYKRLVWQSARLVLQSIPFALVLFFLFPRLSPFWQVPLAQSAKTGLSEQVSIGDINQLVQSNELAFRATFESPAPAFNQFYWRTLVMEDFDGKTWKIRKENQYNSNIANTSSNNNNQPSSIDSQIDYQGQPLLYKVIAEPSYQSWLFALDVAQPPATERNKLNFTADFTVQANVPLSQKFSYAMRSYPGAIMSKQLSPDSKLLNRQLPQGSNPRLTAYAAELRQRYIDDLTLAQAVLERIRQQNYFYTLKPPLLTNGANQQLDQFFFESQQGFCVHYAASFTFIMRAAGIPARLVTGYMGAEYNENGGFYSVYQRDAHAWSEIWLEDKGWTRVDPTAAVSPERVNQGFDQVSSLQQSSLLGFANLRKIDWLNKVRQQLDALDYYWTRWIIGYNSTNQYQLFKQLFGKMPLWKFAIITTLCFVLGLSFIWWLNRDKKSRRNTNQWQGYYHDLATRLAKKKLVKQPRQSLSEFSQLVAAQYPTHRDEVNHFYQTYQRLEYQAQDDNSQEQALQSLKLSYRKLKKAI